MKTMNRVILVFSPIWGILLWIRDLIHEVEEGGMEVDFSVSISFFRVSDFNSGPVSLDDLDHDHSDLEQEI